MTCPEWSRLAALRDDEPEGWAGALEHLDDCQLCRPEALKADPLLVFRRLPVTELNPAAEQSEVESMRQAVAAMRNARNAGRLESRHHFAGWRRWAAAAVLAVASLVVSRDRPHPAASIAASVTPPAAKEAAAQPAAQEPAAIEGLNRPGARVYHMDGEGISVFMIVDESLDV